MGSHCWLHRAEQRSLQLAMFDPLLSGKIGLE